MKFHNKTLAAAAFALVAITVSSTAVHKSFSPGAPVLIPPMLSDGRLFTAQTANIPINEFSAGQTAQGIVLPKDSHNFFTCNTGGSIATRANDLGTARAWIYEFTGNEPPFNGEFFVSDGELAANSKYDSLDTLQTFSTGKRYYEMGAVDMYFKCGSGFSRKEFCGDNICQANESANSCALDCTVCGDGIVSDTEECDDGNISNNDGCSSSCTTDVGYTCDNEPSQCSLLIPTLPGGQEVEDQKPSLASATVDDQGNVTITYTKTFDTCLDLYTIPGGKRTINSTTICDKGTHITRAIPSNTLNTTLGKDDVIRLCKADDSSFCSNAFQFYKVESTDTDTGTNEFTPILTINIDPPANEKIPPIASDVNLGTIHFKSSGDTRDINSLFIAIQGTTSQNTNLGDREIHSILENVRLSTMDGSKEFVATRLTRIVDFGNSSGVEPGTFQTYRFDDISLADYSELKLLVDFTGSNTQNGDRFRMHLCSEPSQILLNGANYAGTLNSKGCNFGGMTYESTAYQMKVSQPFTTITPRGDVVGGYQSINSTTGTLYVTKGTALQSRQLLGGTVSDAVLHVGLRAEQEDIDVTDLRFSVDGDIQSIDRFELYRDDESQKFAEATKGACGTDGAEFTFCANMEIQQLIVQKDSDITIVMRPRIKSDQQGGVSGDAFTVKLLQNGSVDARGNNSSNTLPSSHIVIDEQFIGNTNTVVLSKITSMTNASPDANGTTLSTGVSAIGQFTIAASAHSNSKNGDNDVVIDGMIFNINATNIVLNANSFTLHNKADQNKKVSCNPHYLTGEQFTSTSISGQFILVCKDISQSAVNGEIEEGDDTTFVVQGDVTSAKLNSAAASTLQVTLEDFTDASKAFGVNGSHILWIDSDQSTDAEFHWIEYPETTIQSTSYSS